MLLGELQLVAIDFESTGSVPGYPDQPWQIGLVPIVNAAPVFDRAFSSYLHVPLERPFSPFAPGVWQTVRGELARADSLAGMLTALGNHVLGVPLVAHNAATEKKFFRNAWPLHRPGPWIDTLKLARRAFPGLKTFDLESVAAAAGIEADLHARYPDRAPHDALYDAAACALVLCHLLRQPTWSSVALTDVI